MELIHNSFSNLLTATTALPFSQFTERLQWTNAFALLCVLFFMYNHNGKLSCQLNAIVEYTDFIKLNKNKKETQKTLICVECFCKE